MYSLKIQIKVIDALHARGGGPESETADTRGVGLGVSAQLSAWCDLAVPVTE